MKFQEFPRTVQNIGVRIGRRSMSLLSRRSVRNPSLGRLPSNGDNFASFAESCPNSPAVKKSYRLIVLGTTQTGKTAIIRRFLDDGFEERYIPTIEQYYHKLYKIRGESYQVDILDRSGNDPFPASRKLCYISGDLFVLVSSVDQPQSVIQMAEHYNQILECKASRGFHGNVPIVFVLNKTDLPESKWQVTLEEVQDFVKQTTDETSIGEFFVTCSAEKNENIDKVFGKVYTMGKLPKQANPEFHKLFRNEWSADGILSGRKKVMLLKMRSRVSKDIDEEILIDNGRRPSMRTDLFVNRAKTAGVHVGRAASVGATCANVVTPPLIADAPTVNQPTNGKCDSVKNPQKLPTKVKSNEQVLTSLNSSAPESGKFASGLRNIEKRCIIS